MRDSMPSGDEIIAVIARNSLKGDLLAAYDRVEALSREAKHVAPDLVPDLEDAYQALFRVLFRVRVLLDNEN